MEYGWTGKYLEIDLTRGKIEKKEDHELAYIYIGGKGVGAKLLWDRVPPEVDPFSPDNLLIFSTGPLTGTIVPSANKCCISSRSPQTGLLGYTYLGGFWPPELKSAGYDTIVISGKSPSPVYLWINDDNIEFRDASYLWGKDTYETQRLIKEQLKKNNAQIVCIGPAGENKVGAASIQHGTENSGSRSGIGAVMGDKNLKAIAVSGTRDINVAKPSEITELCGQILKRTGPLKQFFHKIWEVTTMQMTILNTFGNMGEFPFPGLENSGKIHEDFCRKFKVREKSCYNCVIGCKAVIAIPDIGNIIMKCQGAWYAFITTCKILDFIFGAKCYDLCVRYGLDIHSTAVNIAFLIDLYEKGILTKKDTDGLHLEWGNAELSYLLIKKIALREGIGAIMANGVQEAAKLIGKGAEKFAYHVKKLELVPTQHLYYPYFALANAISDRQDFVKPVSMMPVILFGADKEFREISLKAGYVPEKFEKYLDDPYEGNSEMVAYWENVSTFSDLLGLCTWWTKLYCPPITPAMQVHLISLTTGIDITEADANKVAERVVNLIRVYNVRNGVRRKDDTVPEKFFRVPPSSPQRGEVLNHSKFDQSLDDYYTIRGWDKSGIPGKEKLEELGLDYVWQDLVKRGILAS